MEQTAYFVVVARDHSLLENKGVVLEEIDVLLQSRRIWVKNYSSHIGDYWTYLDTLLDVLELQEREAVDRGKMLVRQDRKSVV